MQQETRSYNPEQEEWYRDEKPFKLERIIVRHTLTPKERTVRYAVPAIARNYRAAVRRRGLNPRYWVSRIVGLEYDPKTRVLALEYEGYEDTEWIANDRAAEASRVASEKRRARQKAAERDLSETKTIVITAKKRPKKGGKK